jgi:hypothetical protein
VYLTLRKTEVKERLIDWQKQLKIFGWKVVALLGSMSEDIQAFFSADILVTTTYHWEVMSGAREIQKSLEACKVGMDAVISWTCIHTQ